MLCLQLEFPAVPIEIPCCEKKNFLPSRLQFPAVEKKFPRQENNFSPQEIGYI